jgi:hypothetical protein
LAPAGVLAKDRILNEYSPVAAEVYEARYQAKLA